MPDESDDAPPHGIDLERHACIAAELAEGNVASAQVLERHGLDERKWNESTTYWMPKIAEDAQKNGAQAKLAVVYSQAFGKTQDSLAPVPPMTPEDWATLTVEVQRDGDPGRALARRNLSLPDYIRLSRSFAARLSGDPVEQERFFARYLLLQPGSPEGAR
jgi:hypothetical protein